MDTASAQLDETYHPPAEQLTAFGQGRLSAASAARVIEQHLASCDRCVAIVAAVPDDPFVARLAASRSTCEHRPVESPRLRMIAGYELLDELGRGGTGVVYRARQPALGRTVALKRLHAGALATRDEMTRFRREAETLARLSHPHIVQVYDVGEQEGQPYLALEYVAGGTLKQRLEQTPLDPRQAAELVALLADAIAAAHEQGIIHRDLKPGNVLLAADRDGRLVPKIADFGLAKLWEATDDTRSGVLLGTPSYMAPEQTDGELAAIGPAVDIYALGAVLYEAVAGRPPFRAASVVETLQQVRTSDPVPPRRVQPGVPRDLETICLRCLRKEPHQRYATAADLAADLRRFLHGEPIVARPVGRLERLWKWSRRRPAAAALAVLALVATLAAAVGLQLHQSRLSREAARADANYREARDSIERMLAQLDDAKFAAAPQLSELRLAMRLEALPFYNQELASLPEDARADRARVLLHLGAAEVSLGMYDEAAAHLQAAQASLEELLVLEPDDLAHRRMLAECHTKQGVLATNRHDLPQARQQYEQALAMLHAARDRAPPAEHLRIWASLAQAELNLGVTYTLVGDQESALRHYRAAVALREQQLAANPRDNVSRQALAESLVNLIVAKTTPESRPQLDRAESLLREYLAESPHARHVAISLATAELTAGNLRLPTQEYSAALVKYTAAIDRLQQVRRLEPNDVSAKSKLHAAHGARAHLLAALGKHLEALPDWDQAVDFAPRDKDRDRARLLRLGTLVPLGRHAQVAAEAASLAQTPNRKGSDYFQLACAVSQLIPAAEKNLADQYANQALTHLRQAAAAGHFATAQHRRELESQPALTPLRSQPEFAQFLSQISSE